MVEKDHSGSFVSRAKDPVALRTCRESRNAVIDLYPLCFGSVWHPFKTRFNFSLDTLCPDYNISQSDITLLFTTVKDEVYHLKYLALDYGYIDPRGSSFVEELRQAVQRLKGLKEVCGILDMGLITNWNISCGENHELEFHEDIPEAFRHPDTDPTRILPMEDRVKAELANWEAPATSIVFGWRRCLAAERALKAGKIERFQEKICHDQKICYTDMDSETNSMILKNEQISVETSIFTRFSTPYSIDHPQSTCYGQEHGSFLSTPALPRSIQ